MKLFTIQKTTTNVQDRSVLCRTFSIVALAAQRVPAMAAIMRVGLTSLQFFFVSTQPPVSCLLSRGKNLFQKDFFQNQCPDA